MTQKNKRLKGKVPSSLDGLVEHHQHSQTNQGDVIDISSPKSAQLQEGHQPHLIILNQLQDYSLDSILNNLAKLSQDYLKSISIISDYLRRDRTKNQIIVFRQVKTAIQALKKVALLTHAYPVLISITQKLIENVFFPKQVVQYFEILSSCFQANSQNNAATNCQILALYTSHLQTLNIFCQIKNKGFYYPLLKAKGDPIQKNLKHLADSKTTAYSDSINYIKSLWLNCLPVTMKDQPPIKLKLLLQMSQNGVSINEIQRLKRFINSIESQREALAKNAKTKGNWFSQQKKSIFQMDGDSSDINNQSFLMEGIRQIQQIDLIEGETLISSVKKHKQNTTKSLQDGFRVNTANGEMLNFSRPHYIDYLLVQNNNFMTIDYIPQSYLECHSTESLELWVDRTVELQSLLGNFVCKQRFGQFQYVKGPLCYAMESGMTLILNNFQEISSQLLTALRVLSNQLVIRQNQRVIEARGGFKILGVMDCSTLKRTEKSNSSGKRKKVNKSIVQIRKTLSHIMMPQVTYKNILPLSKIKKQQNRHFFQTLFKENQHKIKIQGLIKLKRRIERVRANLLQLGNSEQNVNRLILSQEDEDRIWNQYLTEAFKSQVLLDVKDLSQNNYQATTYLESISTGIQMENQSSQQSNYVQFKEQYRKVQIGRVQIQLPNQNNMPQQVQSLHIPKIVKTQYSLSILQRVALCNQLSESPLLISETGCGKTTLVQYLASLSSHKLFVYNMSSGSDVMDLVGGFKPIDCKILIRDLMKKFQSAFRQIVRKDNQGFFDGLKQQYRQQNWKRLLDSIINAIKAADKLIGQDRKDLKEQWKALQQRFGNLRMNIDRIDSNLVFSFIQGNLLKALKNGDWVLIDEINLATNDILQKIVPLVENKSIFLYQKGDLSTIQRHPNFRIFGCMNPANDSGKKPLPPNLMDKFTVIVLPQPCRKDIQMMIKEICPSLAQINLVDDIADIYFKVKAQKVVSLRNLSRALMYINRNKQIYGLKRAVYDGLMLGFAHKQYLKNLYCETQPKMISPQRKIIHNFFMEKGTHIHQKQEVFHLTDTLAQHLKDLLRAVAGTQLPVLLQGPTSAGKTSMVRYVAYLSGNKCVRINNHEHTQIEEYLGNYFPDKSGKLVFREGPLVQAVRQGHWLILDQLNLARTEILECLNRLLDDNRQLFLPEQQKHIKPHKSFRIFATQNPSSYSGRKTLSRAFRNRFVSISFTDLNIEDIVSILTIRVPLIKQSKQIKAYVERVLKPLMNYRQRQQLFSKDGMITIRDLLKWTSRQFVSKEGFIKQGFALLGERLRNQEQKQFVEKVLLGKQSKTKGKEEREQKQNIQMALQYERIVESQILSKGQLLQKSKVYVQFNKSFKRMAALTIKAIKNNQAVLLVGQTGCGKTTLAQLLAELSGRQFFSINCHKHMEASDLLGSLRPVVRRFDQQGKMQEESSQSKSNMFEFVDGVVISAMQKGGILLIDQINTAEDSVLERLNEVLESATIGVQRGQGWQTITAKQGFSIIATMNPSGDYGKKELSPALRNRFTEIWVEPITHPSGILNAYQDITDMIKKKLSFGAIKIQAKNIDKQLMKSYKTELSTLPDLIYEFIKIYNCQIAPKYQLQRKLLTMRDIGWICQFVTATIQQQRGQKIENITMPIERYSLALKILAIQGIKYTFSDASRDGIMDTNKFNNITSEISQLIESQQKKKKNNQQKVQVSDMSLSILRDLQKMSFPILLKTSLPLDLFGIEPNHMVFFSPHTDLSDLLGQYKPVSGSKFEWQDKQLLKSVKQGGKVALFDLNLAQQPVIEGVNSLFDHRRSIFVVQLNRTFEAGTQFKPIVILRDLSDVSSNKNSGRKGLPNSVLNRFVKLWIPDVSIERKIQHLRAKYDSNMQIQDQAAANQQFYDKLKELIEESAIGFQCLQLICQLKASNNLHMVKTISGISKFQGKDSMIMARFSSFDNEAKILELLPLIKEHNLKSRHQVQQLISTYTLLKNTKFSCCIYGSQQQRDNFVNVLAYVLTDQRKSQGIPVKKILLSAMTDMNDLLGSYEQMESEGQGNQFMYMESNLVKAIKEGYWLIYVEVPNEVLLERLEKGISDIYLQKVQIIVGIDSSNIHVQKSTQSFNLLANTKFVPIELQQQYRGQIKCSEFQANLTNFKAYDGQFRRNQTLEWISSQINALEDKNKVEAYQRIVREIIDGNKTALTQNQIEISISKIKNQELKKISNQFIQTNQSLKQVELNKISQLFESLSEPVKNDQSELRNIANIIFSSSTQSLPQKVLNFPPAYPTNQRQYKHRLLIRILFTVKSSLLSRMISFLGNQNYSNSSAKQQTNNNEEYFQSISKKFQILYASNWQNFSNNANKILSIIWRTFDEGLLLRFFNQVQRLFEQAKQTAVLQSYVKFNEDQFVKVITVKMNSKQQIKQNVKTVQKKLSKNVKPPSGWLIEQRNCRFTDLYLNYDNQFDGCETMKVLLLKDSSLSKIGTQWEVQNAVDSYIKGVDVNMREVGSWMRKAKVKNYRQFMWFWKAITLNRQKHNGKTVQKLQQFIATVFKKNYQKQIESNQISLEPISPKLPLEIISQLVPSHQNLALHLQHHLKNQINCKTIRAYLTKQRQYFECYRRLCEVKYCSYVPYHLNQLQASIEKLVDQEKIIQRKIRYRGGNSSSNQIEHNYFALKDFYSVLSRHIQQLKKSNFKDITLIQKTLQQLYENYYDRFSDILGGLLNALICIHFWVYQSVCVSRYNTYGSIFLEMLVKYEIPEQVQRLLQKVTEKEDQQSVDMAKLHTQVQRKFNNQIIVDEYTEEGKEKRKLLDEQQFNDLFGKGNKEQELQQLLGKSKEVRDRDQLVKQSKHVLQRLYVLLSPYQNSFKFRVLFSAEHLRNTNEHQFSHTVVLLNILTQSISQPTSKGQNSSNANLNIYEHADAQTSYSLTKPIPSIMFAINQILQQYPSHPASSLATLCNKLYQHNIFQTEVYKVLTDCQFLVEKIYQVNSTMPVKMHIPVDEMVAQCLRVRKIELSNWKSMLGLKIRRRQQSDILQFVRLWRLLKNILGDDEQPQQMGRRRNKKQNRERNIQIKSQQCFILIDKYIRECSLCCYSMRMRLVKYLANNITKHFPTISKKEQVEKIKSTLGRVMGFYFHLYPKIEQRYTQVTNRKISQMKQYQKLAGWFSNEYLIFKATCQKFQRKVHHILKTYEEQLSLSIGDFHKQLQTGQIKTSIVEFNEMIKGNFKQASQLLEGQQKQQNIEKQQKERMQIQDQEQQSKLQVNEAFFQQLIQKVFQAVDQIKQDHHKTQSRLLLIRAYLGDIEEKLQQSFEAFKPLQETKSIDYKEKFLEKWMFKNSQHYFKSVKYYYGIWDKLCQRLPGTWQKQLVQRIWSNVEKIWVKVSSLIPKPRNLKNQGSANDPYIVQSLEALIANNKTSGNNKSDFNHQIFNEEVQKVQQILADEQKYQTANSYFNQTEQEKAPIDSKIISLMKLGYITAHIACNLQKNGLCAQDPQQEQGQQNSQVGDGVGIGQGDIHEGAQNMGEQIQFEQQVQGYKGQEQHENNQNKQEDQGIDMQGQFEGDMYDKQKDQNQDQQGEEQPSNDQQMGSVDDEKRQQDMKNDKNGQKGQQKQADVDIEGGQGQSELVDNQRPQKQQRKAQKRQDQENQEEGQSERSDWDDNNQAGQKINKKQKNEMEQQVSDENSRSDQIQSQEGDASDGQSEGQKRLEKENSQIDAESQQKQSVQQGQDQQDEKDRLVGQDDQQQQEQQEQEQQEQPKRRTKSKKTKMQAYGRKNIPNSMKNPLKKSQLPNQDQNQQDMQEGVQNQEQNQQGNQNANQKNPSQPAQHNLNQSSLDRDFLKDLMQKARNLEEFENDQDIDLMKDLNVDVNQQERSQMDVEQGQQRNQQYQLTQKDEKVKMTNLPSFLDDMKKNIQKRQAEQQKKQQRQRNQQTNKKDTKDQAPKESKDQLSKKQNPSTEQFHQKKQQQQVKDEKRNQQRIKREYQGRLTQPQICEKPKLNQQSQEQLKNIVQQNKLLKVDNIIISQQDEYHSKILSEAEKISHVLEQQLKTVLEPQQTTQYSGDFRTGKKLNLRKIIPYIASNYRKDKIWLRRTDPSQADYHIMLILDDTKSMHYGNVMTEALKGMLSISIALQRLGSIDFAIGAIRDNLYIRKDFKDILRPQKIVKQYDFLYEAQNSHDLSLPASLDTSIKHFTENSGISNSNQTRNLCFIISDGKMNKEYVRPYLREAERKQITYVFIIIDSLKDSIMNIKSFVKDESGKMKIKNYMDDFPFEFFLLVRNVQELGEVLATSLLQFIMEK